MSVCVLQGALYWFFLFFNTRVLELSCKNVDLEPTEGPGVGLFGSVGVHLQQRGTRERARAIGGDVTQRGGIWSQPLTRRAAEPGL